MKKILILLMVLAMAMPMLVACNNTADTPSTPSAGESVGNGDTSLPGDVSEENNDIAPEIRDLGERVINILCWDWSAGSASILGYTGEVKVNFTIVKDTSDPEPVEYKITKGDKSTWYQESSKTLSFTADGDYEDFVGVKINGKELKESYYTVKKGSTIVTLKNSYLKKLDEGKYTITIEFEDGEATGAFRVKEGLDASNPETGDNIGIWFGLMGMSAAAAAVLFFARKKVFG